LCCKVEVSASGRFLVQRTLTECVCVCVCVFVCVFKCVCVTECDQEQQ
jgi:hypothetical protein